MTLTMFYGDLKLILARENDFGDVLGRYKTDFREDKMTLTMFYGDLKLILEKIKMTSTMFYSDLKLILAKRKLLRRCFTAI